jgi:hypothetical protein
MIREWKDSIIFEFDNGYRVSFKYTRSVSVAVPIRVKPEVIGPKNQYLTTNFVEIGKTYNSDELSKLLDIVRNIDKNQEINIL